MNPNSGLECLQLDHDTVDDIDKLGGTILGSSRGPQPVEIMAEFLVDQGIDMLFCVGGDGTQRGAQRLCDEILRRQLPIAVVGIPKTIDNDIEFVSRSFGYATALERATEVIKGAHVEARSAIHGVGLVKLMGRDAGFIAAGATLASQEVNFTLIPEVSFPLHGPGGFLEVLEDRIRQRQHAVVVVAEGAGQHLFSELATMDKDASGNLQHRDIGVYLKEEIVAHFHKVNLPLTLKYLDPSYHIRAAPANTLDRILSDQMARLAVDAAMAGKTNMLVGHVNDHFVHVPIRTATAAKKQLSTDSDVWQAVIRETGQPYW
jgi:6-phosphofructokinase 1